MPEQKITLDRLVRWLSVGGITLAVFFITKYLSSVLLPFVVAWLFAYLLYPMVKFIQYRMHVKVRAIAIIIAMLLVLSVVGLMVYFIFPPMIDQFQNSTATSCTGCTRPHIPTTSPPLCAVGWRTIRSRWNASSRARTSATR